MVSNLGFRDDAAHTRNPKDKNANLAAADLELALLRHPPFVVCHKLADQYTWQRAFGMRKRSMFYRWRRRLEKLSERLAQWLAKKL
mgnify:FL=1